MTATNTEPAEAKRTVGRPRLIEGEVTIPATIRLPESLAAWVDRQPGNCRAAKVRRILETAMKTSTALLALTILLAGCIAESRSAEPGEGYEAEEQDCSTFWVERIVPVGDVEVANGSHLWVGVEMPFPDVSAWAVMGGDVVGIFEPRIDEPGALSWHVGVPTEWFPVEEVTPVQIVARWGACEAVASVSYDTRTGE